MTNVYAGGTLDRVSHRRRDDGWVAGALARGMAAVVWRGQCLVDGGVRALLVPFSSALAEYPWALLGDGGESVFAVDLSAVDVPADLLPVGGSFLELRAAGPVLPAHEAAMFAYAAALLGWRKRARFCGLCGALCRPMQAGHVMQCTECNTDHFPRTDPTVIMLVTHTDRALLAHNARFPAMQMYSTLAGFVEPGESLEEAVAREVQEEAAVLVDNVRYHSSQPWPFPMNLMLGFLADAVTEAITVDPHELLDARWFTRAELQDPPAHGFMLPPPFSIARRMIDDWLAAP